MKQQGAALFFCLILISLISFLMLAMLEQVRWQQRLINIMLISDVNNSLINEALNKFVHDKNYEQTTCVLPWSKATGAFTILLSQGGYCLEHDGQVEIRYLTIVSPTDMPQLAVIMLRLPNQPTWQKFELEL